MTFRYRHGDRPLDGYTIQRGVGRGGFGEVYYAVSDGIGKEVALKSILQNAEIELRGVRHCINLKSPHLVEIYDVRAGNDGVPWVIMEYVSGPSVRDILHEHPVGLGTQRAGYLAREIAKGLAYLHGRGIVHRDLKPENIFYEDGYVKIGDYGLSKFISVSKQSGQTISVGTVHYMAPEIGSGNYSRGIDIYALGIILYEFLTGRLPFTGDSFGEVLMKHLTAKPDLEGIEEPFRSTLVRALEKKPEDRYQTAEEMVGALFQDGDLDMSVALFNPMSLSSAARKAPPPVDDPMAVSPVADTLPAGQAPAGQAPGRAPPAAKPPAAPVLPAAPGPHAEAGNAAAAVQLATPPPAPKAPVEEPPILPPAREEHRERHRERNRAPGPPPRRRKKRPPTAIGLAEASRLDPLDHLQRLARSFFVGGLVTVAVAVLRSGYFPGMIGTLVGFLFAISSGAAAVLVTDFLLADRFQISAGFPRRMVAAVLAAVPAAIGLWVATLGARETSALAFLIAFVFIHWGERLKPTRDERISVGQAIYAGLAGLLLGLILKGDPLVTAAALAAISLVVNAYAPFVPPEIRRRRRDEVPPRPERRAPPAGVAAAQYAAGKPGPTPREQRHFHTPRRPDSDRSGDFPPGPLAQGFWLVAACLLSCTALSLITLGLFWCLSGGHAAEEGVVSLGFGFCFLPYVGFAFYRGLWARRPSPWRRSVRPFLLSVAGSGMLSAAAASVAAIAVGGGRSFPDDAVITCVVIFGTGLFLAGLVLGLERVAGYGRRTPAPPAGTPRATWPVHPAARVFLALHAFAGLALALVFAAVGAIEARGDDRLGFFAGAITALTFGLFFGRQALRRQRGTIWQGTVRPFTLFVTSGGLVIFLICITGLLTNSLGFYRYDDDLMVSFVVSAVVALVLGVFAFFAKGRTVGEGESELSPLEGAAASQEHLIPHGQRHDAAVRGVRPGWAGVGTLLWTLGIPLALCDAALAPQGVGSLLGLEAHGGEIYWDGLHVHLRFLWVPAVILGSLSILVSRSRAGFFHLSRAVAGQAALGAAWGLLYGTLNHLRVSRELLLDYRGDNEFFILAIVFTFVLVGLGTVLLAWRPRRQGGIEQAQVMEEA